MQRKCIFMDFKYHYNSDGNDLLCHLHVHKSMGQGQINPRILKKLADVLIKTLTIICKQFWLTGKVPVDWRLAKVMPIYKKD